MQSLEHYVELSADNFVALSLSLIVNNEDIWKLNLWWIISLEMYLLTLISGNP